MPITIDEMSTEVVAETPTATSAGGSAAAADPAGEVDRVRRALAEAARIQLRLAAEGFDD